MTDTLIAMDRDRTVKVDDVPGGVVPIDLIKRLDKDHKVLAIGNQELVQEAGIDSGRRDSETKEGALLRLEHEHSDFDRFILVDDTHEAPDPWENYNPEEFVEEFGKQ